MTEQETKPETELPDIDNERLQNIKKERGARYGPPKWNHENIGIIWGGILRSAQYDPETGRVPENIVALMLLGLKVARAAYPKGKIYRDNYDDGHNYLKFAEQFSVGE